MEKDDKNLPKVQNNSDYEVKERKIRDKVKKA